MDFSLTALSPIDGRYRSAIEPLAQLLSEQGLIQERVRVEALWLDVLADSACRLPALPLSPMVRQRIARIAAQPDADAAPRIKAHERRINHDVKAVEYYLREELTTVGATAAQLELFHFGCTSEDINNLSYGRLLQRARADVLLGELTQLLQQLDSLALTQAAVPMLARTHGQTATPTTLGKEFRNIHQRLVRGQQRWSQVPILGKFNGAVGNLNAHLLALPDADWLQLSRRMVEHCGLVWNPHTTQIEPHDWVGEYCDALAALNVIAIDACRDLWGYISLGYLRQRVVEGEVGSSTMPHKVNPIDFENAEGNLGIANALLRHFSDKLPISRWQRDLTDSTVQRNLGVALGHTLIAWRALRRGLAKLAPDPSRLSADLDAAWEVLAEAVQTVLRAEGVPNGYELLKEKTRGLGLTQASYLQLVRELPISPDHRQQLLALTPSSYLGLAAQLARLNQAT